MAEEQSGQPSMEEVIKQQKEQCPFCKIVKGEIPSIKVYEDDLVLAIMDINPAVPGHILLMPKEHYPIMPLIPRDVFEHLFTIATYIMRAQNEALRSTHNSIFIANGGVAGQQSTHFMLHILPREKGDSLGFLDAMGDNTETGDDVKQLIKNHLPAALQRFSVEHESIKEFITAQSPNEHVPVSEKQTKSASNAQKNNITELYESNPQFKELLLNHPDQLKELILKDEKLQVLFSGIDVDALSKKLNELEEKRS